MEWPRRSVGETPLLQAHTGPVERPIDRETLTPVVGEVPGNCEKLSLTAAALGNCAPQGARPIGQANALHPLPNITISLA